VTGVQTCALPICPGAGGEIQLTDAMARLMEKQDFHGFVYDGVDYDCGDKAGYLKAVIGYALDHHEIADDARALVRELAAKL